MPEIRQCPQCGAELPSDAPAGVCPKCVMGLGMRSETQQPSAPRLSGTEPHNSSFQPPKPDKLVEHFTQLEILELVGHGGMGAVYKARQRGLDRLVALKILSPEISRDPTFSERFTREARALARLNHPHIVTIHDSGEAGGYYFFVMEYVDGVDLREAIQTGSISPHEALAIVPQICDALQFAHDEGIVHRDIKPENVLIDKNGQVKVADFGLAKLLGQSPDNLALTGTNQAMGTPRYMAPEQIEGAREVDHRADIYSLGVVFYELLTGELPLGRFAPPSKKVQVDVRLDEVVLRTLEKEPGRRYQQASQVKVDVESICEAPDARAWGYEYRSRTTLFGWPLVHIATGIDPSTGRMRVAKGVIAIGGRAIGGLAIGGIATGGIAIGGCAIGLFTLGGASFGLVCAIGGAAIGLGLSVGGIAMGLIAIGGGAFGLIAVGGGALGYYAYGGAAFGVHAYGGNVQDPEALRLINELKTGIGMPGPVELVLIGIAIILLGLPLLLAVMLATVRRGTDRADNEQPNLRDESHPPTSHGGVGWVAGLIALLFVASICLLLPCLATYFWSHSRIEVAQPAQPSDDSTGLTAPPSRNTHDWKWKLTADGPMLTPSGVQVLRLTTEQTDQVNEAFQSAFDEYLALEQQHVTRETDDLGHQITNVEPFPNEVAKMEDRLWTELDGIFNDQQQRVARLNLELKGLKPIPPFVVHEVVKPGLLGWNEQSARIELWQVGQWYHWKIRTGRFTFTDPVGGPQLPIEYRRFWKEPTEEASSED